jgi:hypothetical protein
MAAADLTLSAADAGASPQAPAQPKPPAQPKTPKPAEADAIAWPVTVSLLNDSGIPLSLMTSGLFVGPASSATIVLRSADDARRIRDEVRKSAEAAYISDKVYFESFPKIKG